MKKLILFTAFAVLAASTATVQAKDKRKHDDRDWSEYRDRDRDRDRDHDRGRHWGRDRDRTRTIYVIERDRPVRRVVYIDPNGRYYYRSGTRRTYVRSRYFESYPSRYYTSSGQRRINISLPW
jgi:Ni/Co efflux regulator RcnB